MQTPFDDPSKSGRQEKMIPDQRPAIGDGRRYSEKECTMKVVKSGRLAKASGFGSVLDVPACRTASPMCSRAISWIRMV
jgi:hypothetical protein